MAGRDLKKSGVPAVTAHISCRSAIFLLRMDNDPLTYLGKSMNVFRIVDIPLRPGSAVTLDEISRHFLERSFDPSVAREWLVGMGAVIAVLLVLILFLAVRNRRRAYVPDDWIQDPRDIRATLQLALDQRSRFDLQFKALQGGRRPALRCSGARLEGPYLTLEVNGLQILSSRWDGKEADCFFHLLGNGQILHHAFTTRVIKVFTQGDRCFLHVMIPERIESRQKRSYLRIAPPEEFLLGAALWRGPDLPEDDIRGNIQAWAKPSMVFLPNATPQFSVTDISAGGARLHIPRDAVTEEIQGINVSDRMVFMIDLWDPDRSQRLRFWILCRVQNPMRDFETRGMNIGLQFLAWARPRDCTETGCELEWLRLSGSGEVETLGNWIMRRHLELFRENDTHEPA